MIKQTIKTVYVVTTTLNIDDFHDLKIKVFNTSIAAFKYFDEQFSNMLKEWPQIKDYVVDVDLRENYQLYESSSLEFAFYFKMVMELKKVY